MAAWGATGWDMHRHTRRCISKYVTEHRAERTTSGTRLLRRSHNKSYEVHEHTYTRAPAHHHDYHDYRNHHQHTGTDTK